MLKKAGRGEGTALLMLTGCDKILASRRSGKTLSNPDSDKLPAPVRLAGHTGGTQKPIIVLGKTGRAEGATLLTLSECVKAQASRRSGGRKGPDCGELSTPVGLAGHTGGTQSPSLCSETLVEPRVPPF